MLQDDILYSFARNVLKSLLNEAVNCFTSIFYFDAKIRSYFLLLTLLYIAENTDEHIYHT